MRRLLLAVAVLLTFGGVAHAADPDALWKIVSEKCLPDERQFGKPSPCAKVEFDAGYVILKDQVGDTQYLLMPTAKVTGIEDPQVLADNAPDYMALAWGERRLVVAAAKHDLPREDLSVAINSAHGRTQNQLHIHIDCVAPAVRDAIAKNIAAIGDKWAPFPEPLHGHPYRALWLPNDAFADNPFVMIADGVAGARQAMDKETLVVVGAIRPGGVPGMVLLEGEADAATGDNGSGEELQDHSCALAKQ
ncbi:MAG TPA: CDP-diacylglycerol diphosphatase [Stellaceae bacterium]|nr:CDP-diacylglycerol diphosphatase [Stellaceae bacterium]